MRLIIVALAIAGLFIASFMTTSYILKGRITQNATNETEKIIVYEQCIDGVLYNVVKIPKENLTTIVPKLTADRRQAIKCEENTPLRKMETK